MVKAARIKTVFVCQNCGASSPKWLGRCPDCLSWNSLVEEGPPVRECAGQAAGTFKEPVLLKDVDFQKEERVRVGIAEVDRVLGGGLVRGSVVLIGGDPGIGKSTICMQISRSLAQNGEKVLYVSGEESVKQTKLRADRLFERLPEGFYIVNTTALEGILETVKKLLPCVIIIDSVQVIFTSRLSSSAGSVGQVRECANILTQLAKHSGISVFLVGHVTKEGALAGPRVLEHIVDTVLYFEGERYSSYRILRAVKNRFGSTNEIGVFEMVEEGLAEVQNPSQIFLSERPKGVCGSAVTAVMEGARPILAEVQALVTKANFGLAARRAQGIDYNRLSLLAAVLEKKFSLKLFDKDIFVNVVGGLKIEDPAVDLAVCAAIYSSLRDEPLAADTVVIGEVGLAAEVRSVSRAGIRVNESRKLGFRKCVLPRANCQASLAKTDSKDMELIGVDDLRGALEVTRSSRDLSLAGAS